MFRRLFDSLLGKGAWNWLRWSTSIVIGLLLLSSAAMANESLRDSYPGESTPERSDRDWRIRHRFVQPSNDNDEETLPGQPTDDQIPSRPRRRHFGDSDRPHPRRSAPLVRPIPRHEHEEESLPEAEMIDRKLTARYRNPSVVRLLQTMTPERSLELYLEVSGLIDARHLKPSSYDARVKQAVKNLCAGLQNRAFLQANDLADEPARLERFRHDLVALAQGQPVQSGEDAYQALQWTMRVAREDAGMRPAGVALEFVFAATDSLDKYSGFVPATARGTPSAELEDHIVGIGVEIKPDDHGMLVAKALAGGPAAEAGLRSGDVIEAVNGQRVSGMSLDYGVELLAGPAGSRVTLGVRRDDQLAEMTLTRRRVEMHSVSDARMLDDRVGYIKLEKFAQNSADEFDRALWDLYRAGMKSLIVDVRGNPGGLLTTAIQLSNKFVPHGTIVATRGREAADNSVEQARNDHVWKIPLVVLVDENSASASEIFAAAVQENGRGLIVGRRTYGKGTVQTHFPLQTVAGTLRLTTAQFFSPRGRVMAGAGVEPDVPVQAESKLHNAHFEREAPDAHERGYRHDADFGHEGFHHHEAAYRRGGLPRGEVSHGLDRDMAAALEVANGEDVIEMARQSGTGGNRPMRNRPLQGRQD